MNSQELMSDAAQLIKTWASIQNKMAKARPFTEMVADHNTFSQLVEEYASKQQLDELVEQAIGLIENVEDELIEYSEDDDNDFDPAAAFVEVLFNNISAYGRKRDNGYAISEVVGIAMFGQHKFLHELVGRHGLSNVLTSSEVLPAHAQVEILGLLPIGVAQKRMLEPQKLHNLLHSVAATMDMNPEDRAKVIADAKNDFEINHHHPVKLHDHVVGEYILLAVHNTEFKDTKDLGRIQVNDETMERWEEQWEQWVVGQPDAQLIKSQEFFHPAPFRDALAIGMSDWAIKNMMIQYGVGHKNNAKIGKFQLVTPKNIEDGIDIDQDVQVLGYTTDDDLMGVVNFNAVTLGVLWADVTDYWTHWLECEINVIPQEDYALQKNKKHLH